MLSVFQCNRAEEFLRLHRRGTPFVLANAWDVASARIFESAGFPAIGTTSAGVAATLGFPDGQRIKLQDTVEVVRRIVRLAGVPVSADIEAGYATTPEGVAASAAAVLDAGAVGINIEDATGDPDRPLFDTGEMIEKIAAIRAMAVSQHIHLVINARTDVILLNGADSPDAVAATVTRGNAYREAGADCIFVPDFEDMTAPIMTVLVQEIDAPINIIAGAKTPPIPELEEIGVARVSLGPRMMRAAFALLKRIADEILNDGTYTLMTTDTMSYADVNALFEPAGK
jgi:2-methylisocitrate lyase-like PEP mutase family enzyme